MASEAISEHLIYLGEHAPRPPSLVCLCKSDIHVTPLLKILATGLLSLYLLTLFNLLTSNYYCSQVSPMLRRKQGPQDLAAWKKLKGYKYGENERIRPTKKVVVI